MRKLNRLNCTNHKYIVVLSRSHPELIEFAKYLTETNENFVLLTNFIISASTYDRLSPFLKKFPNVNHRLRKRVIPKDTSKNLILSANSISEIFYRISYRYSLTSLQDIVLKYQNMRFQRIQKLILQSDNIKLIVASEDIYFSQKPAHKLVTLSFHGHPEFINDIREEAGKLYPQWLIMEPFLGVNNPILEFSDSVVSLSEFAARGIQSKSRATKKNFVIPVGPVLTPEATINPVVDISKKLNATYLGRMSLLKGLPTFLKIASEFTDELNFNVCGHASSEIRNQLHNSKMDNIRIHVSPPKDELVRILSRTDIYISPSFYEGFGIAALEAMSFGSIPVCSANSAMPEILSGTPLEKFIFNPFDFDSLVSKIKLILELDAGYLLNLKRISMQISSGYSYKSFSKNFFQHLSQEYLN